MHRIPIASLLLMVASGAGAQIKRTPRPIDFVGFTAFGAAPGAVLDLAGFAAAGGAPPLVIDLTGFTAAGAATPRVAVDLAGFTATGVSIGSDALPDSSTLPARGQPLVGTTPAASLPSTKVDCTDGCFNASGTNDGQALSLRGVASVSTDDGSRFDVVLGTRDAGASYISFARDPGGPPRVGTYAITDQCSEVPRVAAGEHFAGEFVTRAYMEDATSFQSGSGSVVIERIDRSRVAGRFNFVACWFDTEGKRHDARLRGAFQAVR